MQLNGATPLEMRLLVAARWIESQVASEEATRALSAVTDAISVLQAIRYANPGGHTEWSLDGKKNSEAKVNKPSTRAIEIAARVWCDRDMGSIVMDCDSAIKIAHIVDHLLLHFQASETQP